MSIINSDGLNANWQLNVLKGLSSINDNATNILKFDAILNQILISIQAGTDYEAALVLDAANATWLEIRIYNAGTGTFDPPVYYLAGSNIPGIPVAPITYINPNTYLAQIVSNTTGAALETTLTSVDTNTSQLVTNTTSFLRTPGIASLTGAGFTTAGVYSFSIANVGDLNGLVGGVIIPAGLTINFDGGALNNTLDSISFDATGTTFIITYIS